MAFSAPSARRPRSRRFARLRLAVLAFLSLSQITCRLADLTSATGTTDVAWSISNLVDSTVALGSTKTLLPIATKGSLNGAQVVWTSSAPLIAAVDSFSGSVSGLGAGSAIITGTLVAPELSPTDTTLKKSFPMRVKYANLAIQTLGSFRALGVTRTLDVRGTNPARTPVGVVGNALLTFTSRTPTVATVSTAGVITAVKAGTAWIIATYAADGVTDSVNVTITQVAKTVNFGSVTSIAVGALNLPRTVSQLQVLDSLGAVIPAPVVAWTSNAATIATIGASTGVLTGIAVGTTKINATVDGVAASVNVVVAQIPATITKVAGDNLSAIVTNATATAPKVTVVDSANAIVVGATVTFTVGSGGGSIAGASQTTNASGQAVSGAWTLGTVSGANTLVASSGAATATFTATATPAPAITLAFTVQPAATAVGAAIAPSIKVAVTDSLGNVITSGAGSTSSITIALATNPGSALLGGTTTATAVAGVATFSNVTLSQAAAGYSFTATSASLFPTTSNNFAIFGGATQLAFTTQPTNGRATQVLSPVSVSLRDAQGSLVANSNAVVTISLAANPGGSVLGGTLPVAAVGGVATFSNLTLDKVGTAYKLGAASPGLTSATSATSTTFDIAAVGAPAKLTFITQPTNAVAGASITPQIQVAVQDSAGATITTSTQAVTLAIETNVGGGTLASTGSLTVNASAGIATFAGVSLNKSGTGYKLNATATTTSLAKGVSSAFNITPGAATKLGFIVQPTNVPTGGTINPAMTVAVQDANGNTVSTATNTIALTISPATGSVGGVVSVAAVAGIATFSGVTATTVGTGYTLTAAATGLTSGTSSAFNVIAANAPFKLAFLQQPSSAISSTSISPAITVQVQDASGNPVTSPSFTVALAIGTNPSNGTLAGVVSQATTSGLATFSAVNIALAGSGYTLVASATGLNSGTSSAFNIGAGAAGRTSFIVQPQNVVAGLGFTNPVQVAIQDNAGNLVTSATNAISLGCFASPCTTFGSSTTTVSAVGGIATFNLKMYKSGAGFSLYASVPGISTQASELFDVSPAPASTLSFRTQPSGVTAGVVQTPAVQVQIVDSVGNVITTNNTPITVGVGGATISGATTVTPVNGIATFSNLSFTPAGTYQYVATASGLSTASSNFFSVAATTGNKLVFSTQPTASTAGIAIPQIVVQIQDNTNAVVTTASNNVVLSITSGTGTAGEVIRGNASANAVNGIATFSNALIDSAGTGYTITAVSPGATNAVSSSFAITPGTASQLVWRTLPSKVGVSQAMAAMKIAITDNFQNTITTATTGINLNFYGGTSGFVIGGTKVQAAVAGIATFNDITVDRAGIGYSVYPTASGLSSSPTQTFDVVAATGVPSKLLFTVQPSTTTGGTAFSPVVQVAVADAAGTTISSATNAVTLAIVSGTGTAGARVLGTTTVNAANGVASFPGVALDKVGTAYQLIATTSNLGSATSNTFNVTVGAGTQLVFAGQPPSTSAGAVITPAIHVLVADAGGNTVTTATTSITVAIAAGTGTSGATLSGTKVVSAVAGDAPFSTLSIDKPGATYQLAASATGLASATTANLAIVATPTKLVFLQNPSTSASGAQVSPAVTVQVQDNLGNLVTSPNFTVTMAIGNNPTATTLSGTVSVNTSNGIATFSNLTMAAVGSGYTLVASTAGLASGTSTAFNITPGTPSKLLFINQPVSQVAGLTQPNIQVGIYDNAGNLATNSTLAVGMGSNYPYLDFGGTANNAVAAVNGIVTFTGLRVRNAGAGVSMFAFVPGGNLSGAGSQVFDVATAPAASVTFSSFPQNVTVGTVQTPPTQASIIDSIGNVIKTNNGTQVTAKIPGAGVTGVTTVSTVNGVATFNNLTYSVAGSFIFTATAVGVPAAATGGFAVTANAAGNKLVFTTQPAAATAGTNNSSIVVQLQTSAGAVVTSASNNVVLSVTGGTGNTGEILRGSTQVAAVNGVATFSNVYIDSAAANYTLTATSAGYSNGTSSAFTVSPGAATQLQFKVLPSKVGVGQVMSPAVKVAIVDNFYNTLTSSTAAVSVGLYSGPAGAVFGGTTTVNAVAGVATFNDLTVDRAGTAYQMFGNSAPLGLGSASESFDVVAASGVATKLQFTTQPASTTGGTAFSSAVQVSIVDGAGAVVTSANNAVTISIVSGTGTSGASVIGTATVNAVNGVATFTGVSVDKVGGAYQLSATATNLGSATSTSFNVTAGVAAKLVFSIQPSDASVFATISPAVHVYVTDAGGNIISGASNSVTIAITAGTGTATATLNGTKVVSASSGDATFNTLSIDKTGSSYTFTATASGLTSAISAAFNIN